MTTKLRTLINENNLIDIVKNYRAEDIIKNLNFNDILVLVWKMLFFDFVEDIYSDFGVNLLFQLKFSKGDQWDKDWRNDAFLGFACDLTNRYEERYELLKRAYDRGGKNHSGLKISLARCCNAPGYPVISYEEALALVEDAMKDRVYIEGAWALSLIYSLMKDESNHRKWKELAIKLEKGNGNKAPHFFPQYLWDKEINRSDDIESFIKNKEWESLTAVYTPSNLVKKLTFKKAMFLSKLLLENERWDSDMQSFAIDMIEEIKKTHPHDWVSNWKYEAYLGYAYAARGWDYDKEFDAFKRATKLVQTPPPEILMRLALNWSCPGVYGEKITKKEAVEILENVIEKKPYVEAISCLIKLYEETNQNKKAKRYKDILKKSKEQEIYDKFDYLDFFQAFDEKF